MRGCRSVARVLSPATVAVALAACGGSSGNAHTIHVSASMFHGTWPFTVQSGVIACHQPPTAGAITFTAPDGTTYGINGTALDNGYRDVKPIWRKPAHPIFPDQRVYIGDAIDRGLRLCGPGATQPPPRSSRTVTKTVTRQATTPVNTTPAATNTTPQVNTTPTATNTTPQTTTAQTTTRTSSSEPQPLSKAAYEAKLAPLLNDQVVPALRSALANGGARDPQKLQSAISALNEAHDAMASVTPPPAIADLNQQAVTVLGALAADLSNMRAALLAGQKSAYASAARSAVQDALKMQNVGNQMTAHGF